MAHGLDWIKGLTSSDWAIFGLALVMLEIVMPSSWLLWPGLAALMVALIDWQFPMDWNVQLITFASLTLLMLVIGRRFYNPSRIVSEQPDLNEQLGRHHNKTASLCHPSNNQCGCIKLGDTDWRVELQDSGGKDWPEGTMVKVIGQRSNTLLVTVVDSSLTTGH